MKIAKLLGAGTGDVVGEGKEKGEGDTLRAMPLFVSLIMSDEPLAPHLYSNSTQHT
jgi:hypothetical protein